MSYRIVLFLLLAAFCIRHDKAGPQVWVKDDPIIDGFGNLSNPDHTLAFEAVIKSYAPRKLKSKAREVLHYYSNDFEWWPRTFISSLLLFLQNNSNVAGSGCLFLRGPPFAAWK